jgi:hypothetical protein
MSWLVSACIIKGIGIFVKSASNLQSFCFCLWSFSVKLWTLIETKLLFHDRSWLVLVLILLFIYNMKLKEHPNKQAPQVMTLPFNGRLKIQTYPSWIAGSTKFLLFFRKAKKFQKNFLWKKIVLCRKMKHPLEYWGICHPSSGNGLCEGLTIKLHHLFIFKLWYVLWVPTTR